MTDEAKEQALKDLSVILPSLKSLAEIAPDVKDIVQDRKNQEIFNKQAAKIGRFIVIIAAAIGTIIATILTVAKLIVTLGKQ